MGASDGAKFAAAKVAVLAYLEGAGRPVSRGDVRLAMAQLGHSDVYATKALDALVTDRRAERRPGVVVNRWTDTWGNPVTRETHCPVFTAARSANGKVRPD